MKLLLLTFYYQPDLCAGSFRATALAKALLDALPEDASIEVLTTMPNRYDTFRSSALEAEDTARLSVKRIPLSAHKSGLLDQSRAFVDYARQVRRLTDGKRYDLVVATSSRLMTAALGAAVAARSGSPLYLDMRDIFVDTIKDVLPKGMTWFASPFFSSIERWTMRRAARINLVSEGFLPYFRQRYPKQDFTVFTNGIDDEFLGFDHSEVGTPNSPLKTIVYAGNFGEGQGLHAIVPGLARRLEGQAKFLLVGDGGRKRQLLDEVRNSGCQNIEVRPPVGREELLRIYRDADVLFLHLNSHDAFLKVLPSKVFEYAATGKPIWAGVAGYPASFMLQHIDNVAVFPPCDEAEGVKAFGKLEIRNTDRNTFLQKFARRQIMKEMASDICSFAGRQEQRA